MVEDFDNFLEIKNCSIPTEASLPRIIILCMQIINFNPNSACPLAQGNSDFRTEVVLLKSRNSKRWAKIKKREKPLIMT
jgi:hypothetical protein